MFQRHHHFINVYDEYEVISCDMPIEAIVVSNELMASFLLLVSSYVFMSCEMAIGGIS